MSQVSLLQAKGRIAELFVMQLDQEVWLQASIIMHHGQLPSYTRHITDTLNESRWSTQK